MDAGSEAGMTRKPTVIVEPTRPDLASTIPPVIHIIVIPLHITVIAWLDRGIHSKAFS